MNYCSQVFGKKDLILGRFGIEIHWSHRIIPYVSKKLIHCNIIIFMNIFAKMKNKNKYKTIIDNTVNWNIKRSDMKNDNQDMLEWIGY